MSPKILFLDVETTPHIVYTFNLWKTTISQDKIIEPTRMLCWSGKWADQKKVHFRTRNDEDMHELLHEMMSEADVVVHYNGNSFDIPIINAEFLLEGFDPPEPSHQLDLYRVIRKHFKFPSTKLTYVLKALGLDDKESHAGLSTWIGCMNNKKSAWKTMKTYNCQDVLVLEDLYTALLPWIDNDLNRGFFDGRGCPNCGGENLQKRGFHYTKVSQFQRYQCKSCGRYCRGNKRVRGINIQ